MLNIYFNIIFGKTEQCVCFNISLCSSTSSQKVSLFLVSIFIFVCPEEWRYIPKLLCSVWSLYSVTRSSQHQKLKTEKYILHKGRVPLWWGRGVHQNLRKIFSIKEGKRGVLLLLTVTCSVIPDILSSASFKLQTSPSSSASLRPPSGFSWWTWPSTDELLSLMCDTGQRVRGKCRGWPVGS